MKKRNLKNLNLNKKSISNLSKNEVKAGAAASVPTLTVLSCWSCLSCPSLTCTEGVICDYIRDEM
ncbi:hypothetical protein IMCC3317_43780 [Kordia antarctica]|uniref:Uncharacterized protein n=1 Tax=Kordia antarctica TaxID=1218801 RepID=A0A7L4ZQH8_9FLAO|nr:hypothetical protein [Kordia antarctica]QHI38978.1 hypothetical protein IMCC3317_43780 [Kordia antarctica]